MLQAKRVSNLGLLIFSFGLFMPPAVFCQTEKLGAVKFTPPQSWTRTAKENVVTFSEIDQKAGKFCTITLYGATSSTGNPQADFLREWNNLVVKPFGGEPKPKTVTEPDNGWTAIAGGAPVDLNGTKAFAFLTVASGFGKTVSVLALLNDDSYLATLQTFVEGMDIDKNVATDQSKAVEAALSAAASATSSASSATPAAVHIASIIKEFENNEVRANQTWIGKRVRVYGTVNRIEIARDGNIVLDFKSSISTYNNGRCYFNKSQSSRVSAINAHEEATVEGTIKGLGDGFDNSKAYLVLENCTVP